MLPKEPAIKATRIRVRVGVCSDPSCQPSTVYYLCLNTYSLDDAMYLSLPSMSMPLIRGAWVWGSGLRVLLLEG